jgi:hypothetical protein
MESGECFKKILAIFQKKNSHLSALGPSHNRIIPLFSLLSSPRRPCSPSFFLLSPYTAIAQEWKL